MTIWNHLSKTKKRSRLSGRRRTFERLESRALFVADLTIGSYAISPDDLSPAVEVSQATPPDRLVPNVCGKDFSQHTTLIDEPPFPDACETDEPISEVPKEGVVGTENENSGSPSLSANVLIFPNQPPGQLTHLPTVGNRSNLSLINEPSIVGATLPSKATPRLDTTAHIESTPIVTFHYFTGVEPGNNKEQPSLSKRALSADLPQDSFMAMGLINPRSLSESPEEPQSKSLAGNAHRSSESWLAMEGAGLSSATEAAFKGRPIVDESGFGGDLTRLSNALGVAERIGNHSDVNGDPPTSVAVDSRVSTEVSLATIVFVSMFVTKRDNRIAESQSMSNLRRFKERLWFVFECWIRRR